MAEVNTQSLVCFILEYLFHSVNIGCFNDFFLDFMLDFDLCDNFILKISQILR